ncbi:uncharacterized [Lates japonicus]
MDSSDGAAAKPSYIDMKRPKSPDWPDSKSQEGQEEEEEEEDEDEERKAGGRTQGQTGATSEQRQRHHVPGVQHTAQLQRPGPDPLQREDAPEEAAATCEGCERR